MRRLFGTLALLSAVSCAGMNANSVLGVGRPMLTYTCSLDAERCALVANAAAISTAEGWPVAESRDGAIRFLPGPAQSVWAGACDVEMVGRWPVARLCVSHAIEVEPSGVIRVNIVPGALYRKSDFVTIFVDKIFEKAEGR